MTKQWYYILLANRGWFTCGIEGHPILPDTYSGVYVRGECPHSGQFVCGMPLKLIDDAFLQEAFKASRNSSQSTKDHSTVAPTIIPKTIDDDTDWDL